MLCNWVALREVVLKLISQAPDEDRRADLQQMLDDNNIKAILCGRGGYGTGRIIDDLRFKQFVKKPKWIIRL
jgi:muramoyltetrapeptide carboxypeptidase LdcA involved in peptidoglycan recycling